MSRGVAVFGEKEELLCPEAISFEYGKKVSRGN